MQLQDAVLHVSLDPVALHPHRKSHLAGETPVTSLAHVVVALAFAFLLLELTADSQYVALDRDLQIVWLHARQGGSDDVVIARLIHVERKPTAQPAIAGTP